jgi:peptide methionine sulfoxide reductase msrA/msrB
MTYIALLVLLTVGGLVAYQQFLPAGFDSQTEKTLRDEAFKVASQTADTLASTSADVRAAITDITVSQDQITTSSTPIDHTSRLETMLVAGGCFWCVEADLEKLPGVTAAVSGYAGGTTVNPTYQNYAAGGHREVVEVTYDANQVSFEEILIYALKHMDPTDGDGSFADRGEYYAPAFYYRTPAEKTIIDTLINDVNDNGPYTKALAIAVKAAPTFYVAEAYHQDYYKGTLSKLKYQYYRKASGRDTFIKTTWGTEIGPTLPWRTVTRVASSTVKTNHWETYVKPEKASLKMNLEATTFSVTQEAGTERAGTSPLDKNYEAGIYVDVLSGEPLFLSRDKFDSGTGWPSFVKPISAHALTEHNDNTFFSTRTEVRSAIADNHLGHVFTDGPADRGGLRYCMNGVALRFIPKADMEASGYRAYLSSV